MMTYEVIEKYGWVQGRLGNCADGFCIHGALDYVYGQDKREYFKALDKLIMVIGHSHIAPWNDGPFRTVDEVLEVLKKAGV